MIDKSTFDRYANDPAEFRASLTVDVNGVAQRFGDVMDDWQATDFASLDPALKCCAGRSTEPTRTRYYFERSRGHSKTTDLAVVCIWAMVFSVRPLRGFCFAVDREQAAILKNAIGTIIRLNPWIGEIIEVQKDRVLVVAKGHPGETGELVISTSDVASSWGILPDFLICDELTHWQGDGSLWHSLISSAAKRAACLLVVISNAGFADSWQWNIREAARTDEAWRFSRLDGPVASWITQDRLDEQKRMLPLTAYTRLWLNCWSASGGDALLPEDISACFDESLTPMTGKESGYLFVAGCDLGLTRDCSAVVVLAVPDDGRAGKIRLAHNKLWRPVPGKKIDLRDVESYILALDKTFELENVVVDPWQAELLAQRLEADTTHRRRNARRKFWAKPWVIAQPPVSTYQRDVCSLTIESFQDHRFDFYPCDNLRRDLLKLRIEEKSYGFRLTSPRDGSGHGDTFSAFALALLTAHEMAGRKKITVGILSNDPSMTPVMRDIARLDFENILREKEQSDFRRPEDHKEPFRDLMRIVGRKN